MYRFYPNRRGILSKKGGIMIKIAVFFVLISCMCDANTHEVSLVKDLQNSQNRNQIMGLTAIVSVAAMRMTATMMEYAHPGEDRFYWRSLLPLVPASIIIGRCLYKELKPKESTL